ncbi:MAG TPA: hypothetical protein VGA99_07210, partial [bacterium]
YFLEVQDAKGRQLRAQTTVPGLFQITRPADGATFASDSYVEFSWEPSSGAGIYVLGRNLSGCEAEYNDRNFGYYGAFGATTASLIAWLNTFCFTSPQVQTFKVLAYDSALAAYQYSVGRNGSQFQRSNVEGGLGVFGSMVADSLALTITPQL